MADMNLDPKLQSIIGELPQAVVNQDSVKLGNVRSTADEAVGDVRELLQALAEGQMRTVITKLNQGKPLANDEAAVVEDLFVGDAEAYLKEENNVEDWKAELRRLHGVLRTLAGRFSSYPQDPKVLHELGATLRDISQTSISLQFYLQAKDRIEQFNLYRGRLTAPRDMSPEERKALAQAIMQMLASPDV